MYVQQSLYRIEIIGLYFSTVCGCSFCPNFNVPNTGKVDVLPSREPNCNCYIHRTAALIPILSQLLLIHIIRHCFLKNHFNSISYLRLGLRFFNFLCILHISNLRVHLQEDGCTHRYSVFYMHVGRGVCSIEHTFQPTRLLILMHVKHYTVTAYTTAFLKMNPRV